MFAGVVRLLCSRRRRCAGMLFLAEVFHLFHHLGVGLLYAVVHCQADGQAYQSAYGSDNCHAGASAVILSPEECSSTQSLNYNLVDALKEDRTRIRIFGKPEAHVGRRMGVVLCYGEVGESTDALRDKAKRLANTVLGTDPYMKK